MRQLISIFFVCSLLGNSFADSGDEKYKPMVGQHGKDVIWVPTPDEMVTAMLTAARVTANDLVYDLGAGDGKIAIAAAREFGAKAVGIEYDHDMAELARRNATRAGVSAKVQIIRGDIFKEDFSKATVVTMYLLPELNVKLKPILQAMPPGTRVVSHSFDMGTWEPDQRIETSVASGFLWIIPAQVDGSWLIRVPGEEQAAKLELKQSHQKLSGQLTIKGQTVPIQAGRMDGKNMYFQVELAKATSLWFETRVNGDQLSGRIVQTNLKPLSISGSRPAKKRS